MRIVTSRPVTSSSQCICGLDAKIRHVMALFNQVEDHFILVVDSEERLVGTVTDGDLRRALLRADVTTDHPVVVCMQKNPRTGIVGRNAENESALWQLNAASPFLPIVDADGRVVEVLIGSKVDPKLTTALILAGGMGTRLGERTRRIPKPLLPVGDQPILGRIMDQLEDVGIGKIYLAVHHLADQIEKFVGSRKNKADVALLCERQPLGTAGSIGLLPDDVSDHFLVMNGDVLTKVDLDQLGSMHRRNENDATIAAAQHRVEIPFGIIQHSEDGQFLSIVEKPTLRHFVCAGIYCLSPLFKPLVHRDHPMDMPELLNLARTVGMKIGLFPLHEYWIDIGQPADLERAQRDHTAPERTTPANKTETST